MGATIQAGGVDWTVYYGTENRQKRVIFAGDSVESSETKELYLALQDLFDESTQMDDGIPISAQTPTEYTIGIIDAGDADPWFIDKESVEHLTGGALKTASWKRVQDSNVGIVMVQCSATAFNILEADIGHTAVHGTNGDSGTVVDVNTDNHQLWIRPATYAIVNSFDDSTGTITANAHTATQSAIAATGEMLWANIYNTGIATLVDDTHLYVYQGDTTTDTAPDTRVSGYKSSIDWWVDGTLDLLVLVADQVSSLSTQSAFIDSGYISVLARQYGTTYSFYTVNLFAGGRNPIPLECGTDLNNTSGYEILTLSGGSGNWTVGDEIKDTTTNARGIITAIDNPGAAANLRYYYVGNDLSLAFTSTNTVSNQDDTGTGTINGAPGDTGPAGLSGLTITHANNNTFDIDANDTNEYYSCVIDVSSERLTDAFEWAKWKTRRGDTATTFADGIYGEQYIGSDYRFVYTSMNGTVSEGDVISQATTLARGTVVAIHPTPKTVVVRNSRGTFSSNATYNIEKEGDTTNYFTPTGTASDVVTITPIKPCPYGTFAGGVWFLAPGVVLSNVHGDDANSYVVTDDTGTSYQEPTSVSLSVTNTRSGDQIAVFRLSGGVIQKNTYSIDSGGVAKGANTIVIDGGPIAVDEPGKTAGGTIVVVDISASEEHWYRYSSWTGSTFTLFQDTGTATGGDTNTLTDSGGGFNAAVKAGDIIRNTTKDTWCYVLSVDSDTQLTTSFNAGDTAWNGSGYTTNDVVTGYVDADEVYVPLMSVYETTGTDGVPGSETITMVYNTSVSALTRVRAGGSIKPFGATGTIGSTGLSVPVVRTAETIS